METDKPFFMTKQDLKDNSGRDRIIIMVIVAVLVVSIAILYFLLPDAPKGRS